MGKYRKKPVVIEAFRLNERGLVAEDWFWDAVTRNEIITHCFGKHEPEPAWCEIKTLEGVMVAKAGDYIIRGVNGEIYPCKTDIFNKTYDELDMCEKECTADTPIETVERLRAGVENLEAKHNQFVEKWMEVVRMIFGKGGRADG